MTTPPHIFVVHGALGSATQMEPIARQLESLGTVSNVELVGHGQTSLGTAAELSIDVFAEQLLGRLREGGASGAARPYVFGYSMGGYVALALEARMPGMFAGILTLGTKFAWSPAIALRECARLDPDIIKEKVPKFAAVLEQRHRDAGGWELVLERTGKILAQLGDSPLLTRDTLAGIQARVCIAVGEKDDTVSADEAREYASYIPNAVAETIADTPHPIERVPAERIEELMRKLIGSSAQSQIAPP